MSPRARPPRLEPHVGAAQPAPPATPAGLLERAKVAGPVTVPGRTELRHLVERIVAGDGHALGALGPIRGLTMVDMWAALAETYGATPERSFIDPARTLAAAARAAARVAEVAATGRLVAFATAAPASLLGLYRILVDVARAAGGDVADLADVGPLRADGRSPRFVRWVDGVAMVTDGSSLCATRDAEAAREWLFVVGRPALVVGDGPFVEVAWDGGAEVVAFAGLDRCGLAAPAARQQRCVLVPLRTDRAARAYGPLHARLRGERSAGVSPEL
jgi:Phosphatase